MQGGLERGCTVEGSHQRAEGEVPSQRPAGGQRLLREGSSQPQKMLCKRGDEWDDPEVS